MIDFHKYDIEKARFLAKKYGKNITESMVENLRNLDLVNRSELINSIKYSVTSKQGVIDKISIKYAYYGIFLETGIQFQKKNPSAKMLKAIMENYQVTESEAYVISKSILRNGIKPMKWRTKAIEENKSELDREFGEYYAEIILKEIQFDDIKMKH